MNKEIKKVKVTKGRTLEVELVEHLDDKTDREVSMKCDQLVHDDMYKAMDKLKLHLVKLFDLHEGNGLNPEDFDPEDELKNFKVTSFSISGNDESEGVTITGQKELGSGKILNMNTPFTKYQDDLEEYQFASELASEIANCVYEAEQYLFEGKYAVKQLEIPFEEHETEDSEAADYVVTISDKKGKRKSKKVMMEAVPANHEGNEFAEVV